MHLGHLRLEFVQLFLQLSPLLRCWSAGQFQIGWLQSALKVQSTASARLRVAVEVIEEGIELIEVSLGDRIVLVVVADSAFERQAQESGAHGRHAIDHVAHETLFRQGRATIDDQMQSIKSGSNELILGRLRRKDLRQADQR